MNKDGKVNSVTVATKQLEQLSDVLVARAEQTAANPDYVHNPSRYLELARAWCMRDAWTVDEAANLLAGTSPSRPYLAGTPVQQRLMFEIRKIKDIIVRCLGQTIKLVGDKKLISGHTQIESAGLVEWAISKGIDVPEDLIRASGLAQKSRKEWQYSTPQLDAIFWVIDTFWEGVDPKKSATQKEVISALEKEFPDLSNDERKRVDQVTRDPSVKQGRRKGN